jgi:hypothetical protein
VTNPNLLLHLAVMVISAPSREHAVQFFRALCTTDADAAAKLGDFLIQVVPDLEALLMPIFMEVVAQQPLPPPFLWTDADSADTAEAIDLHLHEGGDHAAQA